MGYAADATDAEASVGFARIVHPDAGPIVVTRLADGLYAVKLVDDGYITYSICDAQLVPLYKVAHSLGELNRRFDGRH